MFSNANHNTHFYEQDQEVCKDLERSVHRLKATTPVHCCNGETAIAKICVTLESRCVIILDPFSISDAARRKSYASILKATVLRQSAPSLPFFYSWGKSHASDALQYRRGVQSNHPVWALRSIIAAEAIEILWYHERHYLMWVVVPPAIREQIQGELEVRVEEVRSTLFKDAGDGDNHSWVVRQLR